MPETNLPPPFNYLAVAAWWAGRALFWLVATPTTNVGQLGPFWPLAWFLAIAGLMTLGSWGAARGDVLFHGGEDVAAFGGRAAWLGFGAKIIRTRKKADAAMSGAAVLVGWGGASFLYLVALVWWMCIPLSVGWLWWRWWSQQTHAWDR